MIVGEQRLRLGYESAPFRRKGQLERPALPRPLRKASGVTSDDDHADDPGDVVEGLDATGTGPPPPVQRSHRRKLPYDRVRYGLTHRLRVWHGGSVWRVRRPTSPRPPQPRSQASSGRRAPTETRSPARTTRPRTGREIAASPPWPQGNDKLRSGYSFEAKGAVVCCWVGADVDRARGQLDGRGG